MFLLKIHSNKFLQLSKCDLTVKGTARESIKNVGSIQVCKLSEEMPENPSLFSH